MTLLNYIFLSQNKTFTNKSRQQRIVRTKGDKNVQHFSTVGIGPGNATGPQKDPGTVRKNSRLLSKYL